ncbi:site-specific DNA-methyltransferase [Rothia sp. P7208]|uniref:site-specific DNA-methyltransferase n=1 Tax=Rothia sp. P7208 TaxID=3402660 RepID=UPI003AC1270C
MADETLFEFDTREPIKGFPELRWTGKHPYTSTQYYPAQLRESYGEPTPDAEGKDWMNKIFWGDNLQVMSHLLREYRGQVDLIYIDPPFDSKADYKKKISLRGKTATSDATSFEEKQYGDIWTNDEYLQFMYERLILCRELLSDTGSIYLHCDWHKSHLLRMLLDEVFGANNFINEIIWCYSIGGKGRETFGRKHDTIFLYKKGGTYYFDGTNKLVVTERKPNSHMKVSYDANGRPYQEKRDKKSGKVYRYYADEGKIPEDYWVDIEQLNREDRQREGYPTQKPERLLERIIAASSPVGGLVFDCFMGSGTTQAVAMKIGRRFIGADINLGSISTTTKRLSKIASELRERDEKAASQLSVDGEERVKHYTGFEVYNVNNYDFFRNPVEARQLLIEALEIQPFPASQVWDGELDGRMVKILPVNRIATKADLEELKANLPYKTYEQRKAENPSSVVEKITLVCMGHEPDLKASLEADLPEYKLDIQVVDILRDKSELQLKREAEAEIVREGDKLVIRNFFPLNLLQKLSLQRENVEDWRQLVDMISIDWNYDGVVMQPALQDIPEKNELVKGYYDIPADAGTVKVKITDVLSESLEVEVEVD